MTSRVELTELGNHCQRLSSRPFAFLRQSEPTEVIGSQAFLEAPPRVDLKDALLRD